MWKKKNALLNEEWLCYHICLWMQPNMWREHPYEFMRQGLNVSKLHGSRNCHGTTGCLKVSSFIFVTNPTQHKTLFQVQVFYQCFLKISLFYVCVRAESTDTMHTLEGKGWTGSIRWCLDVYVCLCEGVCVSMSEHTQSIYTIHYINLFT